MSSSLAARGWSPPPRVLSCHSKIGAGGMTGVMGGAAASVGVGVGGADVDEVGIDGVVGTGAGVAGKSSLFSKGLVDFRDARSDEES